VFLSDLPGSLRYSKSTLRGLVSWRPHYVLLCVSASLPDVGEANDVSQVDLALAYLELCVQLELPVAVVFTKLDSAVRSNLRDALARILTAIKSSGRDPIMLPATADITEQDLDLQIISEIDRRDALSASSSVGCLRMDGIPIILTSAVTGAGIGKLHALLQSLPLPTTDASPRKASNGSNWSAKRHAKPEGKMFDINEVFEMPLFKVYSLSSEYKRKDDRGIILCGSVRQGRISVGDRLVVGPISPDPRIENESSNTLASRSKTSNGRSFSEDVIPHRPRTLEANKAKSQSAPQSYWQEVRVVSVRNLRLPAKTLSQHQVGTIGVDPVDPSSCLGRIRKGMLLADFSDSSPSPESSLTPSPPPHPFFHTGFVANFSASDFVHTSRSSALVIGGNAMAYIGSIRAAVRVISAESPGKGPSLLSSIREPDIFTMEDAGTSSGTASKSQATNGASPEIKITFAFISSTEWVTVRSRVLVMPASLATASPSTSWQGLQGFVGRVCEGF
jgi:hypothetical protein